MNRSLIRAESGLAGLALLGILAQVYLIAAAAFGADAIDAHRHLGNAVFALVVVTGALGVIAWKANRRDVLPSAALIVVAAAQVGLAQADSWAGGLHGLLAIVVLALAALVHVRGLRALKGA